MPSLTNATYNSKKHIEKYLKLVQNTIGVLVQTLNYNDVRRLIDIDGVNVSRKGNDVLGEIIVDKMGTLCDSDLLDSKRSLASLFDTGNLPKSLNPKVYICYDLRDNSKFIGVMVACKFVQDEDLGTLKFNDAYCSANGLPANLASYVFIDVFCSSRAPSGTLLIVNAFLDAAKRRPAAGLCAVAI